MLDGTGKQNGRAGFILSADEVAEQFADAGTRQPSMGHIEVDIGRMRIDPRVEVASGRLPGGWLPAPMKIGAFDQPEQESEDFDPDMDDNRIEGAEDDRMADTEMV